MNKPAKDSIGTWAAKRWPSPYFSMWLEEDGHYHAWMERRGVRREGRGTTQKKALIAADEALKAAEQDALQPSNLHDYFAAHAPPAPGEWLVSSRSAHPDLGRAELLALWANEYADAMLAGRGR